MRSFRPLLVVVAAAAIAGGLPVACRPDLVVGSLHASLASQRLGYPETVPLHFEWIPAAPLVDPAGSPTVFVHLIDDHGALRRTFDHPFPQGWNVGRPVAYDIDLYQSALAPPLPKGRYVLTAGLYDPPRQTRWRLEAGAEAGKREYRIGELDVVEPGAWGPSEPDASLQILSRRRLLGPATLRFAGAAGGPTIRLAFTVKGDPLPADSDCDAGAPTRKLEPGFQWVDVAAPARPCEIRFGAPAGAPIGTTTTLDIAALRRR
jgi:hypothetical protein